MKFNTDIIRQISSEAKIKALKYVLNPGFRMTGRELGRICGISHTMAIKILKEFETMNLVHNFRAGRSVVWTPRTDSHAYKTANEFYDNRKNTMPLEHLKSGIVRDLKGSGVMKAVLFGSVAKGRERYLSDIDLFVLVKEDSDKFGVEKKLEEMSDKYEKLYGNTLSPYVLTEKELEKRKKLPLIKNIEKGERLI